MNIEDRLIEAFNNKEPGPLSSDGRLSLADFLALWCVDGTDIRKHETVTVFCSGEDYLDCCPDDRDKLEDGRTSIIALDRGKLLLIMAMPSIIRDGEVVLMSGEDGKEVFSKKLVLST